MHVTALDLGKEELAKSTPPTSPFLGEGVWCVYDPGLGKAGSNLALVTPSEQAQPLPLLRSGPVKGEDGYQRSHTAAAAWNVMSSLHTLPDPAGKPGNPGLFLVQAGLLFLPLAPEGWAGSYPCPLPAPSLGGTELPAGQLCQGTELELGCPSSLPSAHLVLGALGLDVSL